MTLNPLVCAILFAATVASSTSRPDLSGTWVPDLNAHERTREPKKPAAADAPSLPPIGGGILFLPPVRVTDEGSVVLFEFLGDDGSVLHSDRVRTQDKEEEGPRDGGRRVARSRREGRSLKTEWRLTRDELNVTTGLEVWTVSVDARTLIHTSTSEDAAWRGRTKTTYHRKP